MKGVLEAEDPSLQYNERCPKAGAGAGVWVMAASVI